MTWSPTAHQITPFLHVPDLERAIELFTGTLAFEVLYRERNYAYLEFGGAGLRVLEEPGRRLRPDGKARMTVYVDVTDVDALYAQLLPRLRLLPATDVEPPLDKSWKQREFQSGCPTATGWRSGSPLADRFSRDRSRRRTNETEAACFSLIVPECAPPVTKRHFLFPDHSAQTDNPHQHRRY